MHMKKKANQSNVGRALQAWLIVVQQALFCTTSLPLTGTRWFDLRIQAFPHSKKCRKSISATSRIILLKKLSGISRIEPGAAGSEAQMLPLCYANPHATGSLWTKTRLKGCLLCEGSYS